MRIAIAKGMVQLRQFARCPAIGAVRPLRCCIRTKEAINPSNECSGIETLADGEGGQGQFGGYGAHPADLAEPPGDEVVFEPGVLGQQDRHPGHRRRPSRAEQGVPPWPEGPEGVGGEEDQGTQLKDRRGR